MAHLRRYAEARRTLTLVQTEVARFLMCFKANEPAIKLALTQRFLATRFDPGAKANEGLEDRSHSNLNADADQIASATAADLFRVCENEMAWIC